MEYGRTARSPATLDFRDGTGWVARLQLHTTTAESLQRLIHEGSYLSSYPVVALRLFKGT